MRKFSINCDFGGQLAPFDIFIGQPEQTHHPLHFQADWLLKQRGGTILPEVMDAIAKLNTLALENGVPLEDLCVYALGSAQEEAAPAEATADADSNPTSATDTQSQTDGLTAEESSVEDYEAQAVDDISTGEAPGESSNSDHAVEDANEDPSKVFDSTTAAELPAETLDTVTTPTDTQENSEPQKAQDALSDEQQGNENKQ
jgi:hypothetical protein